MAFAFVFPGQGSRSVGMMAAYGDAAIDYVRRSFSTLGQDLWQLVAEGRAELWLGCQYATADVELLRSLLIACGLKKAADCPRWSLGIASENTRHWLRREWSNSRMPFRWSVCVRQRCGGRSCWHGCHGGNSQSG